jgi:membrane protease YdiL (CAAX protease family)
MARRIGSVVLFCLLTFVATLLAQSVWAGLLVANLKTTPGVPWSVAVMAVVLWAMWRYAGGAWWPASTREARARYRRANSVPPDLFLRAMVAGLCGLGALVGLWLALGHLVHVPGNPAANYAGHPIFTVVVVVAMSSVVGAVIEEAGVRGYMLTRLERSVSGWLAVVIVAVVIAPGHGATQGFAAVTAGWYLLSDLLLGSLSLLTRSILPGIVVHAVGLLAFLAVVWPTDHLRQPAALGAQGAEFWIEVAIVAVFAVATILALRTLAARAPDHTGLSAVEHRPADVVS